jgi:hypothetical protein
MHRGIHEIAVLFDPTKACGRRGRWQPQMEPEGEEDSTERAPAKVYAQSTARLGFLNNEALVARLPGRHLLR